jgi:hypothetical protein
MPSSWLEIDGVSCSTAISSCEKSEQSGHRLLRKEFAMGKNHGIAARDDFEELRTKRD